MKKTLSILVLILCVSSAVFAQVRINGWGRAVWVPVFLDQKGDVRSTVQASYGDQPDLEFMLGASTTNIGVDVGVIVNASTFNQIGNAKIWWRPTPDFRLHVGLGRLPTLRGKVEASTGGYAYARGRITGMTLPSGKNEPILMINDGDGIFSRFNLSKMGAILEITPRVVPGLFIGAAFAPEYTLNSGLLAKDVYSGLHIAGGYEIKDVGHFRAAWIGGGSTDPQGKTGNAAQNWDFSYDRRIEAAFALTAVPNFLVDIGFKLSQEKRPGIMEQPGFSLENPLYLAMGVMYTGIDDFRLGFAVDGHFAGTAERNEEVPTSFTSAPQVAFNIYPQYNLGACFVGMDITFGMQFGDEEGLNDKKMFGFGAYAHKQYGNGNIRGGVYVNVPMNDNAIEQEKWGVSVPIWITYSF